MKASRQHTPFVPVVVTLESQAEVDELYALLNDGAFDKVIPNLGRHWEQVKPFADQNSETSANAKRQLQGLSYE